MASERLLRSADLVLWVVAATTAVTLVGIAAGLVAGGGLVTAKLLLFVVGFGLFGFGSLGLRPKSRRREEPLVDFDGDAEWPGEALLQRIPPLREAYLPPKDRHSRNLKLTVTGLVVLGVSLVMEDVFGVAVG